MLLEDLGPLLKSYFRYTVILKGKLSPYNNLIFVHSVYCVSFKLYVPDFQVNLYCSVALVVDSPEFFNRIAETFTSKASLRFLIFLWGEKSSLAKQGMQIPVYTYTEIKNLGQERRAQFSGSNDITSTWMIYIFFLQCTKRIKLLDTNK